MGLKLKRTAPSMTAYFQNIWLLVKRLGLVYLLYTLCRLLFLGFNFRYFQEISFGETLSVCFWGLRFDTVSILIVNALFILLSVLPFNFVYRQGYQTSLRWIYVITNSVGIALNFIDFAYFPFTQKRTTYDAMNLVFGGQSDFLQLIPAFVKDFWYVILLFAALVWGMNRLYKSIRQREGVILYNVTRITVYSLSFLSVVALTVLGIRGGFQRIPLGIVDAGNHTSPAFVPVLLNTPFNIIKSVELKKMEAYHFYTDNEVKTLVNPLKPAKTEGFKKLNVMVIILESFSKEYTGLSGRTSYTPFLDSLMQESMLFTNAWANGKRSIEGIPAILAGMPSLTEDPYINSIYSNNRICSFATALKPLGYHTAFFHGGTNGTMSFDAFCRVAGFDEYIGRSEYPNTQDYDGHWGIWDEPFLQYVSQKLSSYQQPFFASVFTLSSHHPYAIPEQYKNRFPKGTLEIHESIGYADHALRRFFETARKQPWFDNTVFVITPDHTGVSEDPYFSSMLGQYAIPVAFYYPAGHLKSRSDAVFQQIDIFPTVLDYLNYDRPYFAFGNSAFHPVQPDYALYNFSGNYALVGDSLFSLLNNFEVQAAYRYRRDSLLKNDVKAQYPSETGLSQRYGKAFMQTYSNALIGNKTTVN